MTDYTYQSQKLSEARSSLMLPHPRGEAHSIVEALHECKVGFYRLDRSGLDETARRWVAIIDGFLDTSGVVTKDGEGAWMRKAISMSVDDRAELSRVVDELAHWFKAQEPT